MTEPRAPLRLCVLGNSHSGALKLAWDTLAGSYPDVSITFFASRGSTLNRLKLSGNRLVPHSQLVASQMAFTSGGSRQVCLSDFDAFLVYGLRWELPRPDRRLSLAVQRQLLSDVFETSLGAKLCRSIRKRCNARIYVAHTPQLASEKAAPPPQLVQYDEVYQVMHALLQSQGLELLKQPPETLANGWDTKLRFARGSRALDVGDARSNKLHSDTDRSHMNADFGRIYLEHALATMLARRAMPTAAVGRFERLFIRAASWTTRIQEHLRRLPTRVATMARRRPSPRGVAGGSARSRELAQRPSTRPGAPSARPGSKMPPA